MADQAWQFRNGVLQYLGTEVLYRGSLPAQLEMSARRVELTGDEPCFGDEVPLTLRYVPRPGSEQTPARFRFEVQGGDRTLSGHWLMLAALEHSLQYVDHCPFLPPKTHGEYDAAGHDPYETANRWTAALDAPTALQTAARPFRFRGYTFGLCMDYQAAHRATLEAPRVRELERWTLQGTLKIHFPDTTPLPIPPGDEDECLALLKGVSIMQALAGPTSAQAESRSWQGVPVALMVDRIYRRHVSNLVRRKRTQARREQPFDEQRRSHQANDAFEDWPIGAGRDESDDPDSYGNRWR